MDAGGAEKLQRVVKRLKTDGVLADDDALATLPWPELEARLAHGLASGTVAVRDVLSLFRASKRYWARNTYRGERSFWGKAAYAKFVQQQGGASQADFQEYLTRALRFVDTERVHFLRLFVAMGVPLTAGDDIELAKDVPGVGAVKLVVRNRSRIVNGPLTAAMLRRRVYSISVNTLEMPGVSFAANPGLFNDVLSVLQRLAAVAPNTVYAYNGGTDAFTAETEQPVRMLYEFLDAGGWYGRFRERRRRMYLRDVVVRPSWGF